MAIPKVCGIETEYGILARGIDLSAVAASTILVNAYAGRDWSNTWDFSAERPHRDARDNRPLGSSFPETEYHLANTVLTNGARYYVDHAHPEVSSPECRTAFEALLYDLAGDEVMRTSMANAAEAVGPTAEIIVYKNNSDGKGNSYGCHENYLVDRGVPFGRLAAMITPHFVTRQVFCGAGKVGEEHRPSAHAGRFQISQRADFFEEEVGLETTVRRPIVNSRDEPHADADRYRRLHVIVGDANMSQMATYLKVGTTAIILAMIEDDAYPEGLVLRQPVQAIRSISQDPTLRQTVELADGRNVSALDVQEQLIEYARNWSLRHGLESVGAECGEHVLQEWSRVIADLRRDPSAARDRVDWVAKRIVLESYAVSRGISDDDPKMKLIDIQYHDLRPGRGIAAKTGLSVLIDDVAVSHAVTEPPRSTRAYFRGKVLERWPDHVVAANWDSMVIDAGGDALVRIPMDEPLRGTYELVAEIVANAASPAELIEMLGLDRPDDT